MQQDAAQEKNLSPDLALPWFGIAQRGHPSVESRQDVGLLTWAAGSGGTPSTKGVSLPGEVYLKGI